MYDIIIYDLFIVGSGRYRLESQVSSSLPQGPKHFIKSVLENSLVNFIQSVISLGSGVETVSISRL